MGKPFSPKFPPINLVPPHQRPLSEGKSMNRDKVKEILKKYGSHLPDCDLCQPHTGEIPCSCGFTQALSQKAGEIIK